ncbi:hypothetical protein RCC89_00790 [Cytophagaceae bacterium ABcell3]|nr:hypothetical protein RCC89_00790 [Cytophagaceae bacterium ABcell3]
MENLDTRSREELIVMAQDILEEKYPEIAIDYSDFYISVWKDTYGVTKGFFRRGVRYISNPIKSTTYDITVNLHTKEINPLDDSETGLWLASTEEEEVIAELKEKNFLPEEIQADIEYSIAENEEYYLISCFNDVPHIDKGFLNNEEEKPYLEKTLISKKSGKTLRFKGTNPFYYLTQRTFKHYYNKDLYIILNEEGEMSGHVGELVKIASSILAVKQPHLKIDPKDFDIVILGNYKDIIVKYRRNVRFKNRNEKRVYDLAVNIITKEIFPFDSSDVAFYTPTKADFDLIHSVQDIIPLPLGPKMEHTVSENDDYFFIVSISEESVKRYFIDKKTHEVIFDYESYNLPVNNREDISLKEQYARMNGFFPIKPEYSKPLTDMALGILKEVISGINVDDYIIKSESSKDEVKVKFKRLVKFVPLRHSEKDGYQYDFVVNLVTQTIGQNLSKLYFPTKEDAETIKFLKAKLLEYIKDPEEIAYPIEIVEKTECFIITTSDAHNIKEGTISHYRLDKKSATMETVTSPSDFFPTPAPYPGTFIEVK